MVYSTAGQCITTLYKAFCRCILLNFIWDKMGMPSSKECISCSYARSSSVRGLSNFYLSCCINSLLQSFAATTELQELLSRWQPSKDPDAKNVPLELKKALEAMKDEMQTSPHLDFLNCLHHNNICRSTQHDADEVFHGILNLIQEQISDQQIAAEIKNLYKIEMEGCTQCSNCKNVHRVLNLFFSFPLHLCKNTLEDCFKMFFESQKLEGSEAFYCVNCEEKTPSVQGYKLVSLPSILCIHLKRFRIRNGFTIKLNNKVSFPETLNIADLLPPEEHSQLSESRYSLYGVIAHSGSSQLGHYMAYICSTDSKWYCIDDSKAIEVSWEEVQRTFGGTGCFSAYMLLYRTLISQASQESPK